MRWQFVSVYQRGTTMTTRRNLLLAATAVAATAVPFRPRAAQAADEVADFLFVQTASAMRFDKAASKLTLEGMAPRRCFSPTVPSVSPET